MLSFKQVAPEFNLTVKNKVALVIVAFINLMSFCSISLLSLFFPEEAARKGEFLPIYGFDLSFAAFINFLAAPLFGQMLSKLGAKNIFFGAVILSRISTVLFGALHYVQNVNIFTILSFLLRAMETFGATAYFIAGYAIVFTMFPQNIGFIRGLLEIIVGVGTTIGPAVGELLFTIGGFGLPFFCVGGTVILLAVAGTYFLDEVKDINDDLENYLDFIKIPTVILSSCVVMMVSISSSFLDPTLEEYLIEFSGTSTDLGYVYLLISSTFAFSSPFWGYLSDKKKNFLWMMPLGLFLSGLCLISLETLSFKHILQDSMYVKLAMLSFLGIAMSLALVPTFRCMTIGALENGFKNSLKTHGYVGATWLCMYSLGEIIGPLIGSLLFQNFNFAITSIVIGSINIIIAFFCGLYLYSRTKHRTICCTFNITIYLS